MYWLIIISLILFLVLFYFLFAPINLEISSKKRLFRICFGRLANAKLLTAEDSLLLEIRIAGWLKQIDLLAPRIKKENHGVVVQKKKMKKISLGKMKAVLKSFKVIQCSFDIDFGNNELNGKLYPAFYALSYVSGKSFAINYLDHNEIGLEIENNFARIMWAYISS